MALNERDFYVEKQETKPASYTCPHCKRRNEYQVHWIRRTKKDRLPSGADERDRAMFPKLRSYLLRTDDMVTCSTCRRRFEVPSQQSLVFLSDDQPPPASRRPTVPPASPELLEDEEPGDNIGNR
jgi:hypothetical protein